jgi:hypothetical protein
MAHNLPYVLRLATLSKILEKIKTAGVPERFTQDFLSTKLGFKGGTSQAVIPLFKKIGLLGSDGVPTDLYKRYRNPAQSGAAMAKALRQGYKTLYEMNEYAQDASDKELKGLVVQATGAEPESRVVAAIVGSFKTLKSFANFEQAEHAEEGNGQAKERQRPESVATASTADRSAHKAGFNLAYTINLNLPATTDIGVFDAIFKSLKDHLLKP